MESTESLSCLICVFTYLINYSDALAYYIPEENPVNTLIGNIAKDEDIRSLVSAEDFKNLNFYFLDLENKYLKYFSINATSSELTIKEKMDREVICAFSSAQTCQVSIDVAAQSKIGTFFKKITVKVVLEDINDHPPRFASSLLNLRLSESEVSGKSITIDGASDLDTVNNSVKSYNITPSNVPFRAEFAQENPSDLKLVINAELDRETVEHYYFRIIAYDGGNPPLNGSIMVNVTIEDVNDNKPVFAQTVYKVTVKENYPLNVTFLNVTATDLDIGQNANITYRLNSQQTQDITNTFRVNSTTGEMYLAKHLEYVSDKAIKVKVDAVDNGERPLSSQTVVEVTVEDSENIAPVISINLLSNSGYAETSEYATVGFVVAYIEVTDSDGDRNGLVECNVESEYFALQAMEAKEYKIIVFKTLDRESIEKHNLTINCHDFGLPQLTSSANFSVVVLDENDNAPRFTNSTYNALVKENNENGSTVIQVYARDSDLGQNGQVSYYLDPEMLKNFTVNAKTGLIRSNTVFDRETRMKYEFVVYATDAGNPPLSSSVTVSVTINDQNDNPPKFTEDHYEYYIPESQTKHSQQTVLGKLVAIDKDADGNGYVSYSMVGNYTELPFEVLPDGTLKAYDSFDREEIPSYDFKVMAIDNGIDLRLSSVVNVTVHVTDINDNSPVIVYPREPNVVKYITYMMPAQTQVMKIEATDADEGKNAELVYKITKRNDSTMFEMGRNGEVYVSRRLTQEDVDTYFVEITVSDQGSPSRQDVTSVIIVVLTKNVTDLAMTDRSIDKQNIIIAVVVVVVTVIIAAAILVIIWVVRRHDLQKRKYLQSTDHGHVDSDSGFSSDGGRKSPVSKVYQNGLIPSAPILTPLTMPRMDAKPKDVTFQETVHIREKSIDSSSENGNHTVELHRLASLRLQQALIQNSNKQWSSQSELAQDCGKDGKKQEDIHSDLSAETATYDSGIGGSVSDTGDLRISQLQQLVKQNGRRGQPPHKMPNAPTKPPRIIARVRSDSFDTPPERPPPLKKNPYKARSPVHSPSQFSHSGSPKPSLYATSSPTPCSTNQKKLLPSPSPTNFMSDRLSPSKNVVQDLLMYKQFQNGLRPPNGRLTVDESVDTTHVDDDGSTTSGSYYIENTAEDWHNPPVSDIYV